ncbi:MAG: hypothetical protein RMJ97_10055 [Raineya sp.]|nr:hypothetical protein [Raineya sp.]
MRKFILCSAFLFGVSSTFASIVQPYQELKRKIQKFQEIEKRNAKKETLTHCCEVTITTEGGHKGKDSACAPTKEEACGKAMEQALEQAFGN